MKPLIYGVAAGGLISWIMAPFNHRAEKDFEFDAITAIVGALKPRF